jgi:hypothetical protein
MYSKFQIGRDVEDCGGDDDNDDNVNDDDHVKRIFQVEMYMNILASIIGSIILEMLKIS